jgi:hypothetical protein
MLHYNQPEQCACCRATIASGERWVREKIYEPTLVGQDARSRRYHADLFDREEVSCWEKHRMELEIARTAARAA